MYRILYFIQSRRYIISFNKKKSYSFHFYPFIHDGMDKEQNSNNIFASSSYFNSREAFQRKIGITFFFFLKNHNNIYVYNIETKEGDENEDEEEEYDEMYTYL